MLLKRALRYLGCCFVAASVLLINVPVSCSDVTGTSVRSRIEDDRRVFSIEVRDADVTDVLSALAQQSGFNIIFGEGVTGKATLSFKEITFKDALEMIIKANGLMYTIQNNVFWVGKKVDVSGDIFVDIHRLNYADPALAVQQLKGTLSEYGSAFPDTRTNSVIIRDMPGNIERAKDILSAVDTRNSQVVIEARIVEANSNFTRQLGIQWGGQYTSGRDVITGSHLLPTSPGDRNFAVNLPSTTPNAGLGIVLGNLTSNLLLDLELSAAETKGDLKIISRPSISTMNNKPATIHSGLTFRVKLSQSVLTGEEVSGGTLSSSSTLTGIEEIKTGVDLTVTPQITGDDYILLDIDTTKSDADFTRSVDGIPGVSEKSASTNVMIRNGQTVVIGGLYKTTETDQNDSVPMLSNIPVLGYLFRNYSKSLQNEELLVFITPRIVRFDTKAEVLH